VVASGLHGPDVGAFGAHVVLHPDPSAE